MAADFVERYAAGLARKIVFRVRSSLFPGSLSASEGSDHTGGKEASAAPDEASAAEEAYWEGGGLKFLEWYSEQVHTRVS